MTSHYIDLGKLFFAPIPITTKGLMHGYTCEANTTDDALHKETKETGIAGKTTKN